MKYFYGYLLAALLLATTTRAQSAADPVRDKLALIFAPLDKSPLPAPFLEEYGRRLLPV